LAVVSKRTLILLLGALLLLSIVVRYPLVEHERYQTDSYTIHNLSKSILDFGQAKWIFNPLSYFGLYPLSYPTGVPLVLAELSVATGVSVEFAILLSNMMFGLLFCLGVFLLSRQLIGRSDYVLLATFFAVLSARFVDTTYWNGSARGPYWPFRSVVAISTSLYPAS
jgi:type IV secretory pathway VirB3-like protein